MSKSTDSRRTSMTYGTNTIKAVDVPSGSQGVERVVVPSNRNVDSQLGAFEVPQPGIFRICSILEVLVQLLGDGVWGLDPRIGRVDIGCDLAVRSTGDSGIEGRRSISP